MNPEDLDPLVMAMVKAKMEREELNQKLTAYRARPYPDEGAIEMQKEILDAFDALREDLDKARKQRDINGLQWDKQAGLNRKYMACLDLADALAEATKKGEKLLSHLFVDIPAEHEGLAEKTLKVIEEMTEAHRAYVEAQQ